MCVFFVLFLVIGVFFWVCDGVVLPMFGMGSCCWELELNRVACGGYCFCMRLSWLHCSYYGHPWRDNGLFLGFSELLGIWVRVRVIFIWMGSSGDAFSFVSSGVVLVSFG